MEPTRGHFTGGKFMNVRTVRPRISASTRSGEWLRELRTAVVVNDLRESCTKRLGR